MHLDVNLKEIRATSSQNIQYGTCENFTGKILRTALLPTHRIIEILDLIAGQDLQTSELIEDNADDAAVSFSRRVLLHVNFAQSAGHLAV